MQVSGDVTDNFDKSKHPSIIKSLSYNPVSISNMNHCGPSLLILPF